MLVAGAGADHVVDRARVEAGLLADHHRLGDSDGLHLPQHVIDELHREAPVPARRRETPRPHGLEDVPAASNASREPPTIIDRSRTLRLGAAADRRIEHRNALPASRSARRRARTARSCSCTRRFDPRPAVSTIPRSPTITVSACDVVLDHEDRAWHARSDLGRRCDGIAPAATSGATAAGSTSCTNSANPAATRLSAIGRPMLPSPMNPTAEVMRASSSRLPRWCSTATPYQTPTGADDLRTIHEPARSEDGSAQGNPVPWYSQ